MAAEPYYRLPRELVDSPAEGRSDPPQYYQAKNNQAGKNDAGQTEDYKLGAAAAGLRGGQRRLSSSLEASWAWPIAAISRSKAGFDSPIIVSWARP